MVKVELDLEDIELIMAVLKEMSYTPIMIANGAKDEAIRQRVGQIAYKLGYPKEDEDE